LSSLAVTTTKPLFRSATALTLFGAVAAFCTYGCAYAFRRGITGMTFDGMMFWGVSYKIWLVTAQVLGYALSKGIGIKVIAEITPGQRALRILQLIGLAELALLGFALVPAPWNIPFLLLNGLPLGMVYGIVLGFLEGRRQTDAMGLTEFWTPFCTGLLFVLPLLLAVYALSRLPAPNADDRAQRTERTPMNATERGQFIKTFSTGLIAFIVAYVLLTAFRDFRDNFGPEILRSVGITNPAVFTQTETIVAVVILLLMGSLQLVKRHFLAFQLINAIMVGAAVMIGLSTWLFQQGVVSAGTWFTLMGVGLYMAYVPCNGLYFERLVASFRYVSTVGFVVTLADWWGYLGSVAVLLYKNFGQPSISFLDFLVYGAYGLSVTYAVLVAISYQAFARQYTNESLLKTKPTVAPL
jgi:hypothetical protein